MRTSETTSASRNADSAHEPSERKHERKPADAEAVERFRALLAQVEGQDPHARRQTAGVGEDPAADQRGGRIGGAEATATLGDSGFAAASLMQRTWLDAAAPMPPTQAPSAAAATLADLIEKHVRQLMVGEGSARDASSPVLLRLSDSTLPDTDLLLSRSAEGWRLRVESSRADSRQRVEGGTAELVQRFEARRLGSLDIEVVQPDS